MSNLNVNETSTPSRSVTKRNQLLETLLNNKTLESSLEELVVLQQELFPHCVGAVYTLSPDGQSLVCTAAPNVPEFFRLATQKLELGAEPEIYVTTAQTKQLTIVENTQDHPDWQDYRLLATQANIHSSWAQPIVSNSGRFLGVLAFHFSDKRLPSIADIAEINDLSSVAKVCIKYRSAKTQCVLSKNIATQLPLGLVITDSQFTILEVNPSFCQMVGKSADELLGTHAASLLTNQAQLDRIEDILQHLPALKSWTTEIDLRHKDSSAVNAELCFSAKRDANNRIEYWTGLFSDISERKISEQTILHQANYDLLTNLPNRHLFNSKLNRLIKQSNHQDTYFNVLLLDLDYFKEINDTLGHDAGDELLIKISSRLQNSIGPNDTVARLGGDEFGLIIQSDLSCEELEEYAAKIQNNVSENLTLRDNHNCQMFSSLGISRYPEDGNTPEELLKAAEQALYSIKDGGRNGFAFFTPEMHEEAKLHAMLHQELRSAVGDNQLRLHYQPVKNLANGRITHVEALIRWENPTRGLIRPDVFIPLAEKTGLIRDIGRWVRTEALAMIKRMQNYGIDIAVAVNISTAEFYDRDLAQKIVEQVKEADIPVGRLMVEITESLLIRNQQETLNFLLTLQQAGIRVALDDFGTGYSSLSYLASFPADKLKIDRSFISSMGSDKRKQALVDTIISLGHSLEMTVIAEGVETEEDEVLLRLRECDSVQGFFLARPMPETDLLRFITEYPSGLIEQAV